MKQSKDPFEAAFVEQDESPPESPVADNDVDTQVAGASVTDVNQPEDEDMDASGQPSIATASAPPVASTKITQPNHKTKDEDEEEEEENMDVELRKFPSSGDPDKMAIMQTILSQFTEGQMSRYESFRRSGFQKSNMKRLLVSITGSQKISVPMTIVVSGIAKMFVGELVETGFGSKLVAEPPPAAGLRIFSTEFGKLELSRLVMNERKDSGPIRPCHIREAYRRLKLEGKVPRRSVPRLFR